MKYTFCRQWTLTPIQVLRKRQVGNARNNESPMAFDRIVQG
jgi:hypothetical protein